MLTTFRASTATALFRDACKLLVQHETTRGAAKMMEAPGPVAFELTDPRQNMVQVRERQLNPWVTMAEFPWLMTGRNDIAWLKTYLPRAEDFSDDGKTWRAGYGPRLRKWYAPGRPHDGADQLQYVRDELRPPHTSRRAVMSLWDPRTDHKGGSKDYPCTDLLVFQIRNSDTLDLSVTMRSNDCLSGDTEVPLLNGETWTLRELAEQKGDQEFWVYSRDKAGKIVPGRAHHPRLAVRRSGAVRVTLDDGEGVTCTPDHRFLLRDGSYREAAKLAAGDSLMPLYRGLDERGYEVIFDNGRVMPTHRMSWNSMGKKTYARMCVHHADFNKRNNEPGNLQDMKWEEHGALHRSLVAEHNKRLWGDPERAGARRRIIAGLQRGARKRWESQVERDAQAEVMRDSNAKMWARPGFREYMRPIQQAHATRVLDEMWNGEHGEENRKAAGARLAVAAAAENRKKNAAMNRDPEMQARQMRGRVFAGFRRVLAAGEPISEETYHRHRARNGPRVTTVFPSLEVALKEFGHNHRVASVEVVPGEHDFYDLSVDEHHNFGLEAGVFVHNCIWGFSGVNVFNWTTLLRAMAEWTGLQVGTYYHWSDNLHVYERHFEMVREIWLGPCNAPAPADDTDSFGSEERHFTTASIRLMKAFERGKAEWESPAAVATAVDVPWLQDWAYFMSLHPLRDEPAQLADRLAAFDDRRKDWRWAAMAWANRHEDAVR